MSIKTLVKEHVRIEEAAQKLQRRKFRLQNKLDKADSGIEIIDGVVWKIEWAYGGNNQLTKVGKVNEKA